MYLFAFFCLIGTTFGAPNFVFILTDDQDLLLDSMSAMNRTVKLVGNEGATFANAFVNTPICCPSRSTILTGKYIDSLHVKNNSIAGNCSSVDWQRNHEPFTVAAHLKNAGYDTFYAGKYLNQYGSNEAGGTEHVPVGYDWWIGLEGNSKYYDYAVSVNGTKITYIDHYFTDLIKDYALRFLDAERRAPFFMTVAPPAAHAPFTPAPRHRDAFPDAKAVRTPSFNATPHDKHWLVGMEPSHLPPDVGSLDDIQRGRLQTLLAVDELVDEVVQRLSEMGVLEETYVMFTSDNGFHIGQFTQPWDKREPYDTDIRIPFLIRGPNIPPKSVVRRPISAVDFAPTILDLLGLEVPDDMDGVSFASSLDGSSNEEVEAKIRVRYYGEGNRQTVSGSCPFEDASRLSECTAESWCKCQDSVNNTYSCAVHFSGVKKFKFCTFSDESNFKEAYDLTNDPYELTNVVSTLSAEELDYYMSDLEQH